MKKTSYYYEFYRNEIYDIEEMKKNKDIVEIASRVEEYLCSLNDNTDIIKNAIIISHKFRKDLKYEERLHHVRGILFSRQYINEHDILKYSNDIDEVDCGIFEETLFDIRKYSDCFDKEFFGNYMYNMAIVDEEVDITEEYLKGKVNDVGEPVQVEKTDDTDKENQTVDEFFEDSFEVKELLPKERINLFIKYYPTFKEGILEYKGINEQDNPIEYKYVNMGMDDYNQYITTSLEIIHDAIENDIKRKSKNMIFTI